MHRSRVVVGGGAAGEGGARRDGGNDSGAGASMSSDPNPRCSTRPGRGVGRACFVVEPPAPMLAPARHLGGSIDDACRLQGLCGPPPSVPACSPIAQIVRDGDTGRSTSPSSRSPTAARSATRRSPAGPQGSALEAPMAPVRGRPRGRPDRGARVGVPRRRHPWRARRRAPPLHCAVPQRRAEPHRLSTRPPS